jgi:hypothetical protein
MVREQGELMVRKCREVVNEHEGCGIAKVHGCGRSSKVHGAAPPLIHNTL